jgi:hypothetical protein
LESIFNLSDHYLSMPKAKSSGITRRAALKNGVVAAASFASGCAHLPRALSSIEMQIKSGKLKPPTAKTKANNKKGYCAGYAREVANEYCGRNYKPGAAWNFAKNHSVVGRMKFNPNDRRRYKKKTLQNAIDSGELQQGMLIGCYYGRSNENQRSRELTHLVVYLGKRSGIPIFAHNFSGPKLATLDMLYDKSFAIHPVCVITDKPSSK